MSDLLFIDDLELVWPLFLWKTAQFSSSISPYAVLPSVDEYK